jgi:hypothetical protein
MPEIIRKEILHKQLINYHFGGFSHDTCSTCDRLKTFFYANDFNVPGLSRKLIFLKFFYKVKNFHDFS